MIDVTNLIKEYSATGEITRVINDISFKIKSGSFVSIVGQSGSGKSKLLHLLGGLDTPTSGRIYVDGHDITKFSDKQLSDYRRDFIGFVFQDFHLDERKTALQNVMAPMVYNGVHKHDRKKRALKALSDVDLDYKADSIVNTLSGGQKQRVAIARALVNNPKLILADEPTGSLDSKSGNEIMELLASLNKKGYTILMVTHNKEQTQYSDTIIHISDGKIINKDSNIINNDSIEYLLQNILDNELYNDFVKTLKSDNDNKEKIVNSIRDILRGEC